MNPTDNQIQARIIHYLDNIWSNISNAPIINPYTAEQTPPDSKLMKDIEDRMGIGAYDVNQWRRALAATITQESLNGNWSGNSQLYKAVHN